MESRTVIRFKYSQISFPPTSPYCQHKFTFTDIMINKDSYSRKTYTAVHTIHCNNVGFQGLTAVLQQNSTSLADVVSTYDFLDFFQGNHTNGSIWIEIE